MPAAAMFRPSPAASELVPALDCDPLKHTPRHLVVREPHTIQIIQLVEGPPPPPRPMSSAMASSCSSCSSCPSTSDSDCSSYCSSIVTPDDSSHHRGPIPWTDDTHSTRMKRVHAWRDGFAKATASPLSETRPPSLKRKSNPQQTDDDAVPHTPKRTRSCDGHSISPLTGHPCPACDALFASPASLRRHGRAPDVAEACRAAVEYNFESPASLGS